MSDTGLGGGFDREWLADLDAGGNVDMSAYGVDEICVGDHIGVCSFLNVPNPQAGYEYQWMNNPAVAGERGWAEQLRIKELGAEIVRDTDPEYEVIRQLEGMEATPMDSAATIRELVLVRIPEEKMAERRRAQDELNQAQMRGGPEEDFIAGASAEEIEAGQGQPTRFRNRRHHTQFKQGSETRELHTPDSGIVRTEHDDLSGLSGG